MKPLQGRKILITAGPTWVAIDRVRVIANIATGETGLLLARQAQKSGAHVKLLLGPVGKVSAWPDVALRRFTYFNELEKSISQELLGKRYDAVIHAAAVSDYQPRKSTVGKISSSRKKLSLGLVPTPKIVSQIKKLDRNSLLVLFKLEFCPERELIRRARKALLASRADIAVANSFCGRKYKAIILDQRTIFAKAYSKKTMAQKLLGVIAQHLNEMNSRQL